MQAPILASYFENLESVPTLGGLVWYSIYEGIDYDLITKLMEVYEFDVKIPYPKAEDVFARVTDGRSGQEGIDLGAGLTGNYMVRRAKGVQRPLARVVREVVDSDGVKVEWEYSPTLEIELIPTDETEGEPVLEVHGSDDADDHCLYVAGKIQRAFQAKRDQLRPSWLRDWARNRLVGELQAVPMGGKGVYFVPTQHLDEVGRIAAVIRGVGNGSVCDVVPLVDNRVQRQLVTTSIEVEVGQKLKELSATLSSKLRTGGIVAAREHRTFLRQWTQHSSIVKEYQQLLGGELTDLQDLLGIAFQQIDNLELV